MACILVGLNAYRQRLLLDCPPFFLFHALPAALADPQRHLSQQVLHQRRYKIRRQPFPRRYQPIVGWPSPIFTFPVAQQAARLHRLVGGGQHLQQGKHTESEGCSQGTRAWGALGHALWRQDMLRKIPKSGLGQYLLSCHGFPTELLQTCGQTGHPDSQQLDAPRKDFLVLPA